VLQIFQCIGTTDWRFRTQLPLAMPFQLPYPYETVEERLDSPWGR